MSRSRFGLGLTALVVSTVMIAGCSSSGGNADSSESPTGDSNTTAEETGGGGTGDNMLVLYTSEVASSQPLAEGFEKATGIKVEVINGSSGELLGRVKSEAGNAQGDVWFSAGAPGVENPDLFELYKAPGFDNVDPRWFNELNEAPAAMWINAIMYNKDLVAEDEVPTSYAELADPKWQGKVTIADPAASTAAYGQIMGIYNEGGWELVEAVAKNLVISDNSAGPRSISDGEMSLGMFNEAGFGSYQDNPQVALTYPKAGSTAGWTNIYLIKGSQRTENAKKFIDWLMSEEGQLLVVNELPGLRPTAMGLPDPKGLGSITELVVIDHPEDSLTNKEAWLEKWEEIITNV